jgi:hypothetical protein
MEEYNEQEKHDSHYEDIDEFSGKACEDIVAKKCRKTFKSA